MQSEQFCFWLMGFLEIAEPETLNSKQLQQVRNHLNLVFFHEIDPKLNKTPEIKTALDNIHKGKIPYDKDQLLRC
jgi:hypothetical protein